MTTQQAASEMASMKGKIRTMKDFLQTDLDPETNQEIRRKIGKTQENLGKMERQYPKAAQTVSV